ncbi:MAG: hypothetical protein Kow0079_14250 [Vicingaceae bacterium]
MKHFLGFVLLSLSAFNTWSLNTLKMVSKDPVKLEKIDTSSFTNCFFIACDYALDNLNKKTIIPDSLAITSIQLVYTQYRTSSAFNQQKLNNNRLLKLFKLYPNLANKITWEFDLIEQTGAKSKTEGMSYFHGFIISYRPPVTAESFEEEKKYLQQVIKNIDDKKLDYTIKTSWNDTFGYQYDTVWTEVKPPEPPKNYYQPDLFQSKDVITVLDSINLNKSIIVCDVTGSMSPYIQQVIKFIKTSTNRKEVMGYVFFNDGDKKKSKNKKVLKTGGIYIANNNNEEEVLNVLNQTMINGDGGGEGIENDIEAIIEGIKTFPECEQVILIADNLEFLRDRAYIAEVAKPVHTIICTQHTVINPDYLDLAKATNGSIWIKGNHLKDFQLITNQNSVVFLNHVYTLNNNKFYIEF